MLLTLCTDFETSLTLLIRLACEYFVVWGKRGVAIDCSVVKQMLIRCWIALYIKCALVTNNAISGATDEPLYHERFWYVMAQITVGTPPDELSRFCDKYVSGPKLQHLN